MGEGLARPKTPPGGAAREPDRAELARRIRARFVVMILLANGLGAVIVAALLFIAPLPGHVQGWDTVALNLAVIVPYMVLALALGLRRARALAEPVEAWLLAGRDPSPAERERTLAFPMLGYGAVFPLWAGGALLLGFVNAFESIGLGVVSVLSIALGGLATSTVVVLWAQRILREVISLALASGVPEEPVGPGVSGRILLAWTLATGVVLIGLAMVSVATLAFDSSAETLAATVLFLVVVGLSIGLFAVWAAGRAVAEPVEVVRGALAEVERGNLDTDVPVTEGSEVGLLAAGFNRMVAGLRERERLRDLFGRHVGEDVARRALRRGVELGGEHRECAVLFVDLTGSTGFAASRQPSEVVELLNRFFAAVVESARSHGGWVNKFEGDAALCVFGVPEDLPDPAGAALAAARELRDRLRVELPELEAGIGISAGSVVAGNVGAAERFEYTVIGDPVNEAARLTELAKQSPGRVLASEAAVTGAAPTEAQRWRVDGEVELRGRGRPTGIARPLDAEPRQS